MSKFFIENNVYASGDAWVAVEWFFVCEKYKVRGIFVLNV